jgi:hypothetical protein
LSPIQASRNILTGQRENRAIIVPATVKPIRMPLTITVARYQEIRRRVHEARLKRLLADPVPGAGDRSFRIGGCEFCGFRNPLYCPIRSWHEAEPSLPGSEASPEIASQIYANAVHTGMLARLKAGNTIAQVTAWARDELAGLVRW